MTSFRSGVAASVLLGLFALPTDRAAATFQTDFECPVFAEAVDLYAKDHSLIRHSDGVYHLFYAVGRAGEAWNLAGNEIEVGHATSTDLSHWTLHPRVLTVDPAHGWKSRNVWAPHVLRADVEIDNIVWPYLMSYTGVDSSRNQQIGVAVSSNLFDWTDLSVETGVFRPNADWAMWDPGSTWQNCRDSFVFRQGDQLILLASVLTRPEYLGLGTRGAIAIATSTDGRNWTDRGSPLVINDHWTLMASSFITENPVSGFWHLFYTRPVDPGGIHMLTSAALDQEWDIASDAIIDPVSISSELTFDGDNDVYSHAENFVTQAGLETRAVRFDAPAWSVTGLLATRVNPFWQQWTLVEGELGELPTFRDRPGARTGVPSNMDGLFWVNTAEDDSGPYGSGSGCATCGPDEQRTGVLRSRSFTIKHLTLRLWVGGSDSPLCHVALVEERSGEPLRIARGLGSDVMTRRDWDLSDILGATVHLEIADRDPAGHVSVDRIESLGAVTGIPGGAPAPLVSVVSLGPNPTAGPAHLSYDLGRQAEVSLAIYGPDGRLVRRIAGGTQAAQRQQLSWDGFTSGGVPAPAGVYFFRLEVEGVGASADAVKRLTLVR